jgi:gliding motility-associated-like protein
MKHGSFLLYGLLCLFIGHAALGQTTISGIINQYAKVTYIAGTGDRLRVGANLFAVNDRVLVIQMKGAAINTANAATYGDVTALNTAGNYEFATVVNVSGDTVVLGSPLCKQYNPDDSVQMVRVPVYRGSVRVTAQLTCPPWGPGGTGGVLALEVEDSLVLDADIDVSEKGFQGAQTFANGFFCNNNTFFTALATEGMKGEGITHYVTNQFYGRAKLANGGGGAAAGNSGAGGGGNYGAGGKGGNQYSGCNNPADYGALGGVALTDPDRIFLGGGGGGPQRDNGSTVFPGGNGGGIVMVKARIIVGNGHNISANGGSVPTISDEGTSGGGAGGSIILVCNQYATALQIGAAGGAGGSTQNVLFPGDCHGPAGGGGGGVIRMSVASLPGGVTTNVAGGASGLVLNPASSCYNTSYGAAPGQAGAVFYSIEDAMVPSFGLRDTIVCTNTISITLDIGSGYNGIQWSTGETTPSIQVTSLGTYHVRATSVATGCVISDTVHITKDTMTLGPDTVICADKPLTLAPSLSSPVLSSEWQDGSTAPTLTVTSAGKYYVTIQTQSGCTLSDTVLVSVDSIPLLRDTILCGPESKVSLSMPPGHVSYLWSTGETSSSITVNTTGTYTVETVTPFGCTFRDTAEVTVETVSLGNDTLICSNATYTLSPQPVGGFTAYLWQDGSMGPDFQVDKAGRYYVTVMTPSGCVLSDTVQVAMDSVPEVRFTVGDSALCEGKHIVFWGDYTREGLTGLTWDFGDGSLIHDTGSVRYLYDLSGTFTVKLTGHYRACPDDSFEREVIIYPYPVLNIGPDTAVCPGGEPVAVNDQVNGGNGAASWLWSNGETGSGILVTEPGTYYATVTINGCSTTDSILVRRSCFIEIPNVFTPDGDGINDYFFPRELLSRAVTSFRMRVYNRWGTLLFETTKTDGRGWDGRFNGEPQPQGVYVYMLEASFANGNSEKYQGNVTLLR